MKDSAATFHEDQQFRQTWVWLLILPGTAIVWYITIQELIFNNPIGNSNGSNTMTFILCIMFGILFPIFFYNLKLTTEVRNNGLYIRFSPIHLKFKKIPIDKETKHYIRTYKPITEYGGWGIKFGPKGKVFNVSGNLGVQLEFTNGKKLLIGSQKPQQLDSAIRQYLEKEGAS
ncbi:MAG: hypothetical protein DRN71_02890 [Candidatus Nanohalarchaeota archaeon]|nr:MAG: hypothetical protein DRN71_02890 [Candidatus Nanohaloarchaeota archaeon]